MKKKGSKGEEKAEERRRGEQREAKMKRLDEEDTATPLQPLTHIDLKRQIPPPPHHTYTRCWGSFSFFRKV
jgi:hypothetical protein